jgi:hypothetical protein
VNACRHAMLGGLIPADLYLGECSQNSLPRRTIRDR